MTLTCEIRIDSEETKNPNLRGSTHNIPETTVHRIADLGFELQECGCQGKSWFSCHVQDDSESPRIQEVRDLLVGSGLTEYTEHSVIPEKLRHSHFAFRQIRKFAKSEIDSAQYLRMNISGLGYIASHADTTEDGYILRVDKKQKSSLKIGWLDVVITPFASDAGRGELEQCGFNGLEFVPAIFDKPEKVTKPLWMMTSSITLPHCLLPVQNHRGEIVDPTTEESGRMWDDAGRVQPILRYNRTEIEKVGEFDFAKTRELIGGMKKHYRHHYVVSQRFRKAILDGKHRWIDFVPVEIA
jgi:hypothetical protein